MMGEMTGPTESAYETPVAYEQDRPLVFPDFTLIFRGHTSMRPEPGAPTVSLETDCFVLIEPGQGERPLSIHSGQLPPRPLSFEAGGKRFSLTTYLLPDGSRLPQWQLAVFALT